MNRRQWLHGTAATVGVVAVESLGRPLRATSGNAETVRIALHEGQRLGPISPQFIGLGYEISSVARPHLLSARNRVYVRMVKNLGRTGVIRIGGNTADYASYSAGAKAISAPKGSVINRESLQQLASFLDATGWKLIWGLNLGEGKEPEAVEEARAVSAATKKNLLAFEIGNEADLFAHEGHRRKGYAFEDYLAEYRRYKDAIRAKLPGAPFAGPDAASATDWVTRFGAAEGTDLQLLTHHYYRGGQNPTSSLAMLFHPDPKLAPILKQLQQASSATKVPFRICETNSFSGGGKPGVSGTFGAGLWVLDYMFTLAAYDADGVNIETGVNQKGFISSYSPIGDDERGTYTAMPEYYGMLAFSQASRGSRQALDADASGLNLSSYAVGNAQETVLTLINKEEFRSASIEIKCERRPLHATALRLQAPGLKSSTGVTLGGSPVSADGRWEPSKVESVRINLQTAHLVVPPASAALVTLRY